MFDEILDQGVAAIQWDLRITVAIGLLSILALTRIITSVRSNVALWRSGDGKTPPIMPYAVPGIGNMLAFAFDTKSLLSTIIDRFGPNIPVQIRILHVKLHFISGSESVLAIFRGSRDLTTAPASILILENAFGSPASSHHVYERDNTGVFTQPLEGTNTLEPHNRIFSLIHRNVHTHLSGAGLNELATRFMSCLETELAALDIGNEEWTTIPDFYALIKQTVFKASTTAMCGPTLFSLNPNFTDDFWEFDTHIVKLFKNLPRWMIPKSFQVRDKLKASIIKWHNYAEEKFDKNDEALQKQEWEELYGAKLMRARHDDFAGVDGINDEAYAASDLGMIWGANANIVPIIGWSMIDTLVRPELLSQAREEISSLTDSSAKGIKGLNMPKLLASPLLQSIYSEELRLRNGVIIQRVPVVDNFKIGNWKFPKGDMIITSSWHEQRDRSVWNEGPVNGEFHSVEDFWAERFIVYPNDPNSGPAKPGRDAKSKTKTPVKDADNRPKFTIDSVTGSYIPYGGGQKICPGRFYAKQEAIGAMAILLTMFDIELEKKDFPRPNMEYFPFGVVPPLGEFPARMRRRKT
ncbi:cytochrome P450 [Rhexocercosporidium sp. MPI-PUGE-AT-0058]|nr:cytochrome P450 [Rhexocercosporidium sp. MPI-PUGE-AT-0058]